MKLLYITNARIPTEKAHGLQIVKMCEAFQRLGLPVALIVPFRLQSPAMRQVKNLWEYYEVDARFRLKHLFALDFVRLADRLPGKLAAWLYYAQCLLFSLCALAVTVFERHGVYYSRDLPTIFVICLTKWLHRKPVFFEAHELHGEHRRLLRWLLRRLDGLIVITQRLQALYAQQGVPAQRICVAPDGIDPKRFLFTLAQDEARKKLHIPLDRKIVCYTGHLFAWKGVYTLVESARDLPATCLIYIVGGMEEDMAALQQFVAERQLKNIVLTGYVPYQDVPPYLSAADVLVLPNTAKVRISQEYTSPLKLFEYMGARRPMVAADLPSLREILRHGENAYLVPPDDPQALAAGIVAVLNDPRLAYMLTETAYQEVQAYTWDVRAERIMAFIEVSLCRR